MTFRIKDGLEIGVYAQEGGGWLTTQPTEPEPEPEPGDITDLAIASIGSSSASLTWTPNGQTLALERRPTGGTFAEVQTGISGSTVQYTNTGLAELTDYDWQLTWDGGSSNIVTDTTLEQTAGSTDPERQFTISMNGVGGVSGEPAQHSSGLVAGKQVFDGNAGNTVYTDSVQFNGRNTIQMTVDEGSIGFGSFGGSAGFETYTDGSRIYRGDEIWARVHILFPVGWQWNEGRSKFFRMRVYRSDGSSPGYNDLYINSYDDIEPPRPWWFIFEGEQNWRASGVFPDDAVQEGEWITIEQYLKFDHLTQSEGGDARYMLWINGELLEDEVERRTMDEFDNHIREFGLFLYYGNDTSGGSPVTQSVYVNDLTITTATPSDTDAQGNPYIGTGGLG